jgi:hypothetical protein
MVSLCMLCLLLVSTVHADCPSSRTGKWSTHCLFLLLVFISTIGLLSWSSTSTWPNSIVPTSGAVTIPTGKSGFAFFFFRSHTSTLLIFFSSIGCGQSHCEQYHCSHRKFSHLRRHHGHQHYSQYSISVNKWSSLDWV